MPVNWIAVFCAALIPTAVGFVWYNPKVFGTAWMNASGMTEEKAKQSNMFLIIGLSLVFSLFVAVALAFVVIHQAHVFSLMVKQPGFGDPNSKIGIWLATFMKQHGSSFRTFGHGVVHGTINGLLLALPIVGLHALYEQRGFKYVAIHVGYWLTCMALMGGLISAWVPA